MNNESKNSRETFSSLVDITFRFFTSVNDNNIYVLLRFWIWVIVKLVIEWLRQEKYWVVNPEFCTLIDRELIKQETMLAWSRLTLIKANNIDVLSILTIDVLSLTSTLSLLQLPNSVFLLSNNLNACIWSIACESNLHISSWCQSQQEIGVDNIKFNHDPLRRSKFASQVPSSCVFVSFWFY